MKRLRCPGCGTELELEATQCPVCLRPRDRAEIIRCLKEDRRAQEARRRRPLLVLAALVVAVAAAAALKRHGPAALRKLSGVARAAAKPPARAAAHVPAPIAVLPPVGPSLPQPQVAPPGPALPPGVLPPTPKPPAPPPDCVLSGRVYGLLDLRPVSGARLSFRDSGSGRAVTALTDAGGIYRIKLRKGGEGWELSVKHARFRSEYLEEGQPPFPMLSRERRVEAARDALGAPMIRPPLVLATDALEHNIALLPLD